jgi:hypothetical protein
LEINVHLLQCISKREARQPAANDQNIRVHLGNRRCGRGPKVARFGPDTRAIWPNDSG